MDYEPEGFRWIDCHQEEKCVYVFERIGKTQRILVLLNFSDSPQTYTLKSENIHTLTLLLATDNVLYGGNHTYMEEPVLIPEEGTKEITIEAFTGLMYEIH